MRSANGGAHPSRNQARSRTGASLHRRSIGSTRHEDRFAVAVLNNLLGGGMSSRLFQNIREKQGLAYAVFSELTPYSDAGMMTVYAGTAAETVGQVIDLTIKEFRALKESPVGDEELRRSKITSRAR